MKCLKCKNEDHRVNAKFCRNCGTALELINVCTNKSCVHHNASNPLPDNFAHCDQCGAESSFFEKKIINYDLEHLPF